MFPPPLNTRDDVHFACLCCVPQPEHAAEGDGWGALGGPVTEPQRLHLPAPWLRAAQVPHLARPQPQQVAHHRPETNDISSSPCQPTCPIRNTSPPLYPSSDPFSLPLSLPPLSLTAIPHGDGDETLPKDCPHLTHLDVSHNKLSGELSWRILDVGANSLYRLDIR